MPRVAKFPAMAAAILVLALAATVLPAYASQFQLGFKALADQIPGVAGDPTEEEHYGNNGDSLQQTSTGLMVWRKADNWTAFTNGSRTWVNGPFGVMERANEERFDWEGEASPPPATGEPRVVPSARGVSPQPPVSSSPDAAAEQAALEMINKSRQEHGVAPLAMDATLQQVAQAHARDMAARNFFAHSNPDGLQPWDRAKAAGVAYSAMRENIGWSLGYASPTDGVMKNHQSMMAETPPNDGHRVAILDPRMKKVGIGVYKAPDGKIYYVADFIG